MAITAKNFSIQGVEDIVQSGENALNRRLAGNEQANIIAAIARIRQKIEFLKGLEQQVLDLFPAPNSRRDVQNKIAAYNSKNFANFFSFNLREVFIKDFIAAAKATQGAAQQDQNKLAQYIAEQLYDTANNTKITGEDLGKLFNKTLTTVTVTDKGAKISTSTRNTNMIGFDENKVPYVIVEKLTPAMRNRLQEVLDSLNGDKSRFPNIDDVKIEQFQAVKDTITIQIKSEWFSLINGMSKEQIEKEIAKGGETGKRYEAMRDKANKGVIELLVSKVSGDVKKDLEDFLIAQVKREPNLFFVGKASTEVTGLLGEISAIMAIKELTGKKPSLQWTADNMAGGKKISVDVVLHDILGINVKNTSQNFGQEEGFHDVKFIDRSPDKVLTTLFDSSFDGKILGTAFETSYFNKSYQIVHSRPHVVPGSNRDFDSIEQRLLDFRQKLTTYLYQYAPEMLYMATDDLDKQLLILDAELSQKIQGAGNILYMVGGVPFFPSEMLGDLVQDLEMLEKDLQAGNSFRNESFFFHVGGSGDSIINILNDWAKQHKSVKLEGGSSFKNATIQMTSSWLF